jgi:hypothetical protein
MKLSVEVERILESLKEQNGDDLIDEESALLLYGGKPSTFNQLALYQQLQYALILISSTRDSSVAMFNELVEERNNLARAVKALQGNREQRRRGFK